MNFTQRQLENLSKIDPTHFTANEVAGLLRFHPKWWIKLILGTAIRQGVFIKDGDFYSLPKGEQKY
jgi:hypothetical protein